MAETAYVPARPSALRHFRFESVIAFAGLAIARQVASYFLPSFLFPPLQAVAARFIGIFTSADGLADAFSTFGRILAGLAGAFILGGGIGLLMGRSSRFYRYAYPLLNFNQGIPALSWVVISIIWLRGIEFRIFFIMVMTTLPSFSFQVLDAYRSMSKDCLLYTSRCV